MTGIHEEASEEDIEAPFDDIGYLQHIIVNRDRRTGRVRSTVFSLGVPLSDC